MGKVTPAGILAFLSFSQTAQGKMRLGSAATWICLSSICYQADVNRYLGKQGPNSASRGYGTELGCFTAHGHGWSTPAGLNTLHCP